MLLTQKILIFVGFAPYNTQNYNEIFYKITDTLQEYIDSGEISTVVADAYTREIERYGENTVTDAENLFFNNSEFTLQCLNYNDEEKISLLFSTLIIS